MSTTGIGSGSQHIDVGATLRIDTVTGMVKANVDSAPEVNNSGNIDYTGRVELVAADFEITQLTPGSSGERADLRLSAFNAAGAQQEGAYLTDAIAADGTPDLTAPRMSQPVKRSGVSPTRSTPAGETYREVAAIPRLRTEEPATRYEWLYFRDDSGNGQDF